MNESVTAPIEATDSKETVYRHLRERMIKRELLPNQKLDINELALLLGVSRTPVRDALNMLEADGFVAISPRKGTFVAGIDKDQLIELYQYRSMVELFCLEQSFELLHQDHSSLELTSEQWLLASSPEKYDEINIMKQDEAFHRAIVRVYGNEKIIASHDKLNCHIQIARSYMNKDRVSHSLDEHNEIIQSIKEGNVQAAKEHLKKHLDNALEYLIAMLKMVKIL